MRGARPFARPGRGSKPRSARNTPAAPATPAAGSEIRLQRPSRADSEEFCRAARASAELHHPWLFPPTDRQSYLASLARLEPPSASGHLVRRTDTGELVGFVNLNEIILGSLRSASIGYGAFVPHQRRGYISEGVALTLDHAFGPLGLHRIEANVQPGNDASAALLRGLGFHLEGYSPRLLSIGGEWRDHFRWAILAEQWLASGRVARA